MTGNGDLGYSRSEMMIVASARQLAEQRVCFVGIGLPNVVCNLAQRTVEPSLQLVYESGIFGSRPERLPLSIGDPTLVTGSTAVFDLLKGGTSRKTGEAPREIPAGAVVVPGSRPAGGARAAALGVSLYAPVIVKYRDEKTTAATALEEALR